MAIAVTQIAAATATLTWMALDIADPAVGKPSALGAATGAIAGLATITPAAGVCGPLGAVLLAALSAGICRFMSTRVKA